MADNMTDKQFEKILKMVEMILDGCKDLGEAKAKVKELTGGDSLAANIQLVLNNARLAAKTASALTSL